jgi:hypothetical protein
VAAQVPAAPQHGDTIIKLAGAPLHRGMATLVSEVAIGGAAATADEYVFTRVAEVSALRDGSMLVVDRGSGKLVFVREYDASGTYLRTLGRYGEGPGEYAAPNGLAQLPDGRVLIRDGNGNRINVYSQAGESLGQWPSTEGIFATGNDMLFVDTLGMAYMRMIRLPARGGAPASRGGLVRWRGTGTMLDTLWQPELPDVAPPGLTAELVGPNGSRSSSTSSLPYGASATWTWSPLGYFVTAVSDRYAVDLRVPGKRGAPARPQGGVTPVWQPGDQVISIRRTITPVAIADAERAERRRRIEETMRERVPGWTWTGQDVPRVKPPYKAVRVGADGRIWVQLSTPSEKYDPGTAPPMPTGGNGGGSGGGMSSGGRSGGSPPPPARGLSTPIPYREPTLYDVFEPDGQYLGQVSAPYDTRVVFMRGDFVWGNTVDADGVETVRRFRISWR